jgi:tRNA pseudouridine55 synthase
MGTAEAVPDRIKEGALPEDSGEPPSGSAGKTGLLLINKAPGITSFQTLAGIKKVFYPAKVGHAGTLDKFACGLLLVLVGRGVKLTPWFAGCDKHYEGTIRFGIETDTLDPEGAPVAEADPPSRECIEAALPRFRGDILQTPPLYSALHVEGQRAYRLARSGKAPPLPRRSVSIYALDLVSYDPPLAAIRVHCSKGTYIRSLARDIALAAGSRGHLLTLRRTRVAGFSLADAVAPEDCGLPGALLPLDGRVFEALGIPVFRVDGGTALALRQGKPIGPLVDAGRLPLPREPEPPSAAVLYLPERGAPGNAEELAAIIEKRDRRWSYGYVYNGS